MDLKRYIHMLKSKVIPNLKDVQFEISLDLNHCKSLLHAYCVHQAQDVTEKTKNSEFLERIKMPVVEMSCRLLERAVRLCSESHDKCKMSNRVVNLGRPTQSFKILRPTLRWNLTFVKHVGNSGTSKDLSNFFFF